MALIALGQAAEFPQHSKDVHLLASHTYLRTLRTPFESRRASYLETANDVRLCIRAIFEDGFWLTRNGWRYADTPQVITVYGLGPWLVGRCVPRLWRTLEPDVELPNQPPWLARMTIADEARPGATPPAGTQFGLSEEWPGMEPDFDDR